MRKVTVESITRDISEELGMKLKDVRLITELFNKKIRAALVEKHPIQLKGIGVFKVKPVAARTLKNHFTDEEEIHIDACHRVSFRASEGLRRDLSE